MATPKVLPLQGEVSVDASRTIRYSLFGADSNSPNSQSIIFIPGFKGFKDWGGWPWFCSQLAGFGHRVLSINPSMCGVGPALDQFDEPDKFAKQTLSHDIQDMNVILDAVISGFSGNGGSVLIGHSRGGLVAALTAGQRSDVTGVVSIGTPHDLVRISSEEIRMWREEGKRAVVNARTGEILFQDLSVLEDYIEKEDSYDAVSALGSAQVPALGIHGTSDLAVSEDSLEILHSKVRPDLTKKYLLSDGGHTLGLSHPYAGPHAHAEEALSVMRTWLEEVPSR
ncbi:MAG: hypothetical protein H8E43_00505 [Planctomycetia bacterium]|nr:hypothetical protein [Planctomycetia bacterium]MBL6913839.1 hypothetical protein [Planctomycetota bacterium]